MIKITDNFWVDPVEITSLLIEGDTFRITLKSQPSDTFYVVIKEGFNPELLIAAINKAKEY